MFGQDRRQSDTKPERDSSEVNGLLFPRTRKADPGFTEEIEAVIGKAQPVKQERDSAEVNMLLFPRSRKGDHVMIEVFVERRQQGIRD